MMTGIGPGHEPFLIGHFHENWDGIHVVDFEGNVKVYDDMDPFTHVHVVNSYENATGIVLDLGAYAGIPFGTASAEVAWGVMDIHNSLNKTLRDSKPQTLRSQVRRFFLNNVTGKTTVMNLTGAVTEDDFFKINPAYQGYPYCIFYSVRWFHDKIDYTSMSVVRHDVCIGSESFWYRPNTYVNEPTFIPSTSGGAEDEGVVIFTAIDGEARKAIFVALDAHTFTEIERIELPHHIPFTAHGLFVPETSETVI